MTATTLTMDATTERAVIHPTPGRPGLFNDQSFYFETLRGLGYAHYRGADIGEVLSTADRIPDGDESRLVHAVAGAR